jgi:mono/diheme cytochrome c family protein
MANIKKDKTNPILLFLELALIAYIIYWFFTDNYTQAKNFNYVYGLETQTSETTATQAVEEKKSEFTLNEVSAKSKARGRELYETTCKNCHGPEGKGDGEAGKGINPKPRNFHNTAEYKFGTSLENLLSSIQKGSPGTSMAGFDFLPLDDQIALTHYISQWVSNDATSSSSTASQKKSDKTTDTNTQITSQVEDLSKVKLDSLTILKTVENMSLKTEKKNLTARKLNAEDALIQLINGKVIQSKVSAFSHVVISSNDLRLNEHLKDINNFIEFINSEYVRFNTGFSYSHLNYNDISILYSKVLNK